MLCEDNLSCRVVIIDWGLATIHSDGDPPMTAFAGSAFSVAPEVIRRSYDKMCDLWSCGVITYFLLTRGMVSGISTSSSQPSTELILAKALQCERGQRNIPEDFVWRIFLSTVGQNGHK